MKKRDCVILRLQTPQAMAHIKNIIFDFGNVLIPIDEALTHKAFKALGARNEIMDQEQIFLDYEVGKTSTKEFLKALQPYFFRKIFLKDIEKAWCALLLEFPDEHLNLLKKLKKDHSLFLYSNTNAAHIEHVKNEMGPFTYKQFSTQFTSLYYSQELGMRKPNADGFEHILKTHDLKAEETLFIDDKKENTQAAEDLGIHVWNINPETESVLNDLDKVLSELRS